MSNVTIGENSIIKDFCSIEDSSVAKNVEVGPFARLRNGVVLGDSAKVGNFVEIKKSKLGQGSKANHHTYLGDTEIGKKVNIGAGTITCNYDGKVKHKTTIQDGSFIGSNSSLVCLLYTSPSPRDISGSRMPSSA